MTKKVFIALPTYSQHVHVFTLMSIISVLPEFGKRGWEWHIHAQVGDALLPRARNMLMTEALLTKSTDFFQLDDDVQFTPEDFFKILEGKEDVMAGVYRIKNQAVRFPANWLEPQPKVQENGLIEAQHVPFGFCRIRIPVLERMIQAGLETWVDEGKTYYNFCGYEIHSNMYWGEDYTFCNKWRSLGGKVWVDPTCELTHHGLTGFTGKVLDHLKDEADVTDMFKKALAA